jgi:hypothetical protein
VLLTIWLGWQNSFIWTKALMFSPNPKPGKTLNKVIVEVVKSCYNSDEVRRVMPITDYISMSMLSKHMNRKYCHCAIWKSYTLILIICIQSQNRFFEICIPATQKLYYSGCKWYTQSVCIYNSPKCDVGSLQSIQTSKKQWASPFYVPTLSLNWDLPSTSNCFLHGCSDVQDLLIYKMH